MKRLNGLHTDTSPENQPQGTYRNLQNGMLSRDWGSVVNEDGFIESDRLPSGYYYLGHVELSDGRTVIYSTNGTSSEIGTFDGVYTSIINSTLLNFSLNHHIDSSFKENEKGEFIIYWTDNLNPPRKLNINNTFSLTSENLYLLNIFPSVENIPSFTINSINDSGGSLKTGSYYIGISYINKENVESNTFLLSNEICIYDESQTEGFEQIDGGESGITTSKSFTFSISDLDVNYNRLNIYVIPRYNNEVRNPLVIENITFSSSITYTITGNETFVEKSLTEFQVDYASYKTAQTLNIIDDNLYMGNVNDDSNDIGFQPFANNIQLHCVTEECAINSFDNSYKDPLFIHNKTGFNPGEVYAFYISFILKNGKETPAYHIPGREPVIENETLSVDSGVPFGTNNYAVTPGGIDIGSANTTGTLTFQFTDHQGNTNTFDVNVTSGDTITQVKDAIIAGFSDIDFTIDFAGDEITVRATAYGAQYNGASLWCITNYSYIDPGAGEAATNNTIGGSTDTDDVTDIFTIDNVDIPVTIAGGTSRDDLTTAIVNELNSQTTYTITQNSYEISAIEDSFNVVVKTEGSGATYTKTGVREIFNISNGESDYSKLKDITGDREPKFYEFRSNLVNGMEYWQNDNETYPDNDNFDIKSVDSNGDPENVGSLRGENVRHHRFPRAENNPFFEGGNLHTSSLSGRVHGIKIKNFKIPTDIYNKVVGWKFYYAKPNTNNKLIISQGCTVPVNVNNDTDEFANEVEIATSQSDAYIYGLYDFNALLNNVDIGSVTHIEIVARLSESSSTSVDVDSYVAETWWNNTFPTSDKYLKVRGKAYIPANVDNVGISNNGFSRTSYKNSQGTSHLLIQLTEGMPFKDDGLFNGSVGNYGYYYINLHSLKTDVYQNFALQELEWTGHYSSNINNLYPPSVSPTFESNNLFGGDTFIGRVALKHLRRRSNTSKRRIIDFIALSQTNINLRHDGERSIDSYYPKVSVSDILIPDISDFDEYDTADKIDNYIEYSDSYSRNNNIKSIDVFNYLNNQDLNYPHRIIRNQGNSQGLIDNFQRFLPDDYIEIPAYKGSITKLLGINNLLYIHTKRTLYRTYGKEELTVGDDRAFIGTGDLFARKPQEILDIDGGYGGLSHIHHSIYCEKGYFFIDEIEGTVYRLGENLSPISDIGLRDFFASNSLFETITQDNNLDFLHGWRIGYDTRYNRLFLSKVQYELDDPTGFTDTLYALNNGAFEFSNIPDNLYSYISNKGFTLSYLPDLQKWESFHDYTGYVLGEHLIDDRGFILKMSDGDHGDFVNQFGGFLYTVAQSFGKQMTTDVAVLDAIFRQNNTYIQENFDTIQLSNSYQNTGSKTIVLYPNENSNSRWVRNQFRFNDIFDLLDNGSINPSKPWYDQEQLKDTYIILSITYTGNKTLYLNDIKFITHE